MLGSLFSQLSVLAGIHVDPGIFALLGMGAMMGANLQAPLATLHEAHEILERSAVEALYVQRQTAPGIHHIYGVLTREMVESAYQ